MSGPGPGPRVYAVTYSLAHGTQRIQGDDMYVELSFMPGIQGVLSKGQLFLKGLRRREEV